MSEKKFYLPAQKIDLKRRKERQKALDKASLQDPSTDTYLPPHVSAIVFTFVSALPLLVFWRASLPILLLAVGIWVIGISAFWRHRNKVEKEDRIPAEELTLDDMGFHWKKMSDNPEVLDVSWDDFEIISFEPMNYYLKVKKKITTKHPRIMLDEKIRLQIIEFIEQNTKLKKIVKNKRYRRDWDYVAIYFVQP